MQKFGISGLPKSSIVSPRLQTPSTVYAHVWFGFEMMSYIVNDRSVFMFPSLVADRVLN